MTVFTLVGSEWKRMTSGPLPKVVLVALTLVPLLYGALYLYANWDPYSKLDQLKAALVVNDQGTMSADGSTVKVGEQVADTLVEGKKFQWVRVGSDREADDGVAAGTYAFALKIPQDFSANLASPENFDAATQAMLAVTTNDANNYLLSSIVEKVTSEVHSSVSRQVSETTANRLLTGYGSIHTQLTRAAEGADRLATGLGQLQDGLGQLRPGSAQLRQGAESLHAVQGQLVQGAQKLEGGLGALSRGQEQLTEGANRLADGSGSLQAGLRQLKARAGTLPAATDKLAQGAEQVAGGTDTMNAKVRSIVSQLDGFDRGAARGFNALLNRLVGDGVLSPQQRESLQKAVQEDVAGMKKRIGDDVSALERLNEGSRAVATGSRQLALASRDVDGALTAAASGAEQLNGGARALVAGQQRAGTAVGQLRAGAGALADGQRQAAEGSARLAEGARSLEAGVDKAFAGGAALRDGADTLATQLKKGVDTIPHPDEAQRARTARVMGDPVAVDRLSQAKAPTYGAGLAPFFLALALWIGAFLLVQVLRPLSVRALASNVASWKVAVAGWWPFVGISVVQAGVLYSVVHWGLGLSPQHFWLTLGFLLLASIAFTAIVHGVVVFFGGPGKFIVLVLLVLQLVSSGGTFPWQTAPAPLRALHAMLPMSYVVDGLRDVIYGARLDALLPLVVALIGFTALGLTLGVLGVRRKRTWSAHVLQPQIRI